MVDKENHLIVKRKTGPVLVTKVRKGYIVTVGVHVHYIVCKCVYPGIGVSMTMREMEV